jgi:uncharacterized damage-inducible protein DinB
MNDDLRTFYGLVRRTRAGVLDWIDDLPPGVVATVHPDFAFGSLLGIYGHIASCYLRWVEDVGLGRERRGVEASDVAALRRVFDEVDAIVDEALGTFTDVDAPMPWTFEDGDEDVLSRRWLILHPITHEFHHKGQALALARVLGYPHPGSPDTDLVPPRG